MTNLGLAALAAAIGAMAVLAVPVIEDYTPVTMETCFQGTCSTVSINRAQVRALCQNLADSAFTKQLGGIEPDSPCGKLLGL
jgi:predicted aconitase